MTVEEKLQSLTPTSVWRFPKQETDFDDAFKSVLLFQSKPSSDPATMEDYFTKHHQSFSVSTHRHRILSTAQMYGLLTKANFYTRSGLYIRESVTPVFTALAKHKIGSYAYNTLKTEQILKIKMRAIIDTQTHCAGWNVFCVIFCYLVLKELQDVYQINRVTLEQFHTYIMTCGSMREAQDAIKFISQGGGTTGYLKAYKDDSRFVNILKQNLKLFCFDAGYVSLNHVYTEYFQTQLLDKISENYLEWVLASDEIYADFLYHPQKWNINLIDPLADILQVSEEQQADLEYEVEVDAVSEDRIDRDRIAQSHTMEPSVSSATASKKYVINPVIGKSVIVASGYTCQNHPSHVTFPSAKTGKPYMEAHHLIPMSNQAAIWATHGINIDCPENIISLCPTCHRAIHYAQQPEFDALIKRFYQMKKDKLLAMGLNITLEELKKLY